MAKEKKIKVKKKIDWKHEMALAPGYIIVILWVAFTFMLLGWIIAASLSTTTDIFAGKALKFPSGLHFENYVQAWGSGGVATFFTNSLLYAVVSCVLLILICAPAAYVLARYTFIGNKIIQTSLVSAMGIPITMIVLPLFGVVANLEVYNTADGKLKFKEDFNIPYTTIFLLTFFANISSTYEEAAALDGCPPAKAFWKIMFPMAQSGLVTVTIFNFINIWNEYFLSLIFANNDALRPVAVGLYGMLQSMQYTGNWAGMFAAVIIVFAPTFVLSLFLSEVRDIKRILYKVRNLFSNPAIKN